MESAVSTDIQGIKQTLLSRLPVDNCTVKQEEVASDVVEMRLAHALATFGPTDGRMIMNDELKGLESGFRRHHAAPTRNNYLLYPTSRRGRDIQL